MVARRQGRVAVKLERWPGEEGTADRASVSNRSTSKRLHNIAAGSRFADRAVRGHVLRHLVQLCCREGRPPQRALHHPLLRLQLQSVVQGGGAQG